MGYLSIAAVGVEARTGEGLKGDGLRLSYFLIYLSLFLSHEQCN